MDERDGRPGGDDGEPQARGAGRTPRSARFHLPDPRVADEREQAEREMTEDRELADEERVELFRDSMQQSVLPDLPDFPGWHCFWATTSNPRDSIQFRQRLGYKLIRVEEFPGWDGTGILAGGVDGVVGVNEMVAMRVPMRLYQRYMLEAHHLAPLAEEEKVRALVRSAKAEAARETEVEEFDGTAGLVQRTRQAPSFVE